MRTCVQLSLVPGDDPKRPEYELWAVEGYCRGGRYREAAAALAAVLAGPEGRARERRLELLCRLADIQVCGGWGSGLGKQAPGPERPGGL